RGGGAPGGRGAPRRRPQPRAQPRGHRRRGAGGVGPAGCRGRERSAGGGRGGAPPGDGRRLTPAVGRAARRIISQRRGENLSISAVCPDTITTSPSATRVSGVA